MPTQILIIGGGLAGLAAATALAPHGFEITILEARNRLGGRAGSFTDAATGQTLDNCQHVTMGCCTQFAHWCQTVGIAHFLAPQPVLHFMSADGRITKWKADKLPAPFHLARSFWKAHFLTWADKFRIARGLAALIRHRSDADPPLLAWLKSHSQTDRTIERFWSVVLTSALNETPDRLGLHYARKVFMDGFIRSAIGGTVYLPTVPLGRLYGEELQNWLNLHNVSVRLNSAVRQLHWKDDLVDAIELRTGEHIHADAVICAVPHERVPDLLPQELSQNSEPFRELDLLGSSPITSVHLWYDRPIMDLPHVVLVGCIGQWVFNRGQSQLGEHGVQVVISASRQWETTKNDDVCQQIVNEMNQLFEGCRSGRLLRSRVVTERSATFSAGPGIDRYRPVQATPIRNLFLAGDWTQTAWPATMESAVRSGYLAAEAVVRSQGESRSHAPRGNALPPTLCVAPSLTIGSCCSDGTQSVPRRAFPRRAWERDGTNTE